MTVGQTLRAWAEEKGYHLASAGVGIVTEARRALQERRERGEIDPAFYRENLEIFSYLENFPLENPRSVILVAVPRPAHVLTFHDGEKSIDTILPPTYVRYRRTLRDVRDEARAALAGSGYGLEALSAPLKTLGAQLGLVHYGRNNIGYAEGMGSFIQLVGLVSDLPLDEEKAPRRPEEALLERCRKCRACQAACPTGAIGPDRFLLHAEKCYTLFSESMNPIPDCLLPPSPECLIGCLKCQLVCPENKGHVKYEKAPVVFSAEETQALLDLAEGSEAGLEKIQDKVRELGLSEIPRLYGRNLLRRLKG
jgi:epoxyqueuosine reductase